MIPGLLPLVVLLLFVLRYWKPGVPLGTAVGQGALRWAGMAVLMTEGLSLAAAIGPANLRAAWSAVALGVSLLTIRDVWRTWGNRTTGPDALAGGNREEREIGLMGFVVLILSAILAIALLSAPNTWDAMTYHMARVMHWQQQHSLAPYATAIDRQLASNPLSEILILHFQVLTGTDRLASLPQWLALAGSAAVATALARRLGASVLEQALAAVFLVSLPMALLQGSGTQNDFAPSFFLLVALERLTTWRSSRHPRPALELSASVGLAILAKGTAYFFAAPLGLLAAFTLLRPPFRDHAKLGLAMAALILALNFGHFARNYATYGTPLGAQFGVASTDLSVKAGTSNLLRGLASNLSSPSVPLNDAITAQVTALHGAMGQNVNDPATTFPDTTFGLTRSVLDENLASNPVHITLIALALLLTLIRLPWLARPYAGALGAGAMVLGGFLLFCLFLRWQPWITRLQLPFFVMAAPVTALFLGRSLPDRLVRVGAWGLLLAALPWVVVNQARPLYGEPLRPYVTHMSANVWESSHDAQVFAMRPTIEPVFWAATAAVAGRTENGVGLVLGGDAWEYPFWVLLNGTSATPPLHPPIRLEHVCQPRSGPPAAGFAPDVLLQLARLGGDVLTCEAGTYDREATFPAPLDVPNPDGISVYRRRK